MRRPQLYAYIISTCILAMMALAIRDAYSAHAFPGVRYELELNLKSETCYQATKDGQPWSGVIKSPGLYWQAVIAEDDRYELEVAPCILEVE